jgi:hypothetical protein
MANITEESLGLEALMRAATEQDKTKVVKPQVCDIDDAECLSCGS